MRRPAELNLAGMVAAASGGHHAWVDGRVEMGDPELVDQLGVERPSNETAAIEIEVLAGCFLKRRGDACRPLLAAGRSWPA